MKTAQILTSLALAIFVSASAFAQEQVVPRPAKIEIATSGKPIEINAGTRIVFKTTDANFLEEGKKLANILNAGTGLKIKGAKKAPAAGTHIFIVKDDALKANGESAYKLTANAKGITIVAGTPRGVFYASQSLAQMLPTAFFDASAKKTETRWIVAEKPFDILDFPRFGWRAVHLDEARHFFGMATVKRVIDQMALLKMNILHWHLTDDAGWRIEIKKYPRLTEIGSKRKDSEIGTWNSGKFSGKPHGGFYTQEQIKEIVAYAAARHITIVPEIEMPGHASAATVAYPWLSLKPLAEVPTTFVVNTAYDPTSEKTYEFLSDVLDEVAALFPSKILHIGGDEVRYNAQWKGQPKIDAFMKAHKIKSLGDLHLYFSNRMSQIIAKKGRRMMGWNEIFGGADVNNDGAGKTEGTLDKNAVIHFWKGNAEMAKKAIRAGHDIVNSTHNFTYLDYGYGSISLEKAYNFEPIWAGLEEQYQKHVLGLGCQMWTEWVANQDRLDYQMFPRVVAYAEVGWTQKDRRDYTDFKRRMKTQAERMDAQGIKYAQDAVGAVSKADFFNTPKAGSWTPQTLKAGAKQTFDISALVQSAGTYQVTFLYDRGACAVDISSAEILENGKTIARDVHDGFSGGSKRNIAYKLNVPAVKSGAKYELRATLKGNGGNDSYGDVYMQLP